MKQRLFSSFFKDRRLFHILRRGFSLGWCPICQKHAIFYKRGKWLRDDLRCIRCHSIPRWRALIWVLETHFPNWRDLHIHESSPGGASSDKLARECRHFTPTHYFPDIPLGQIQNGYRCENLESQTFASESFDLVVTQDVFEHVLGPSKAFSEIERTLKPGGSHIFTVPWYYWKETFIRVVRRGLKQHYLAEPEYHYCPIDPKGSLVVTEWGWDLCDVIYRSCRMTTTANRILDRRLGIDGAFIEVFVSRKTADGNAIA
jgi:hypothetical protein